jgi:general secretion pathway protein G
MQRSFSRKSSTSRRRAFTLIEVMIAIAIVVALIALVGINVLGNRDSANINTTKIQMSNIENALTEFEVAFNRLPSEDEGLEALWSLEAVQVETEEDEAKWRRFLTKPVPNDLWGNPWGYRPESEYGLRYDLWSNGPDGEEGTDDDITNWTAEDEAGGGLGAPTAP